MTPDEKMLRSGKKIEVLGFPVGLDIYFFNPFRICNLATQGEWANLTDQLRRNYNRFLAFWKIKRLEKDIIGPGSDFLLNENFRQDFNNIKADIGKPNIRLVWKVFWADPKQADYDHLSRDLNTIPAEGLSDHSMAVFYHFNSIINALEVNENPKMEVNTLLWKRTFEFWYKTLENSFFWGEIEHIVQSERDRGGWEFKNYNQDDFKKQLIDAVYNTCMIVPLNLIESETDSKKIEENISKFLNVILRSSLGDESIRYKYAKMLAENLISKSVTRSFKSVSFKEWMDEGKYRKLYDTGMAYIEKIHDITYSIELASHDNNIHTSTFLEYIPKIPDIHSRVISPLESGLLSSDIFSNDLKDKTLNRTLFAELILLFRILTELNIDPGVKYKLIKSADALISRFGYDKLKPSEIKKLNTDAATFHEIYDKNISKKFYMTQYCYFLQGEYADPDGSIYKEFQKQDGIVIRTTRTFVPRSRLASDFHNKKIAKQDIIESRRLKVDHGDLNIELETLKQKSKNILTEKEKVDELIHQFELEKKEIVQKGKGKLDEFEQRVNKKKIEALQKSQYANAIKTNNEKINESKSQLNSLEKQMRSLDRGTKLGRVVDIISGVLIFLGLIFYIIAVSGIIKAILIWIGFFGFIGNAIFKKRDSKKRANILDSLEKEKISANQRIKKLSKTIQVMEKAIYKQVHDQLFGNERLILLNEQAKRIQQMNKKHDSNTIKTKQKSLENKYDTINDRIDSIISALKRTTEVLAKSKFKHHPIIKRMG